MKAWKLILGPLIVLIMTVTGCNSASNQTGSQFQQTEVIRGDLTTNIRGSGKITLATDAKLSFGSSGKLVLLNLKEGDKVTSGQVLAKIDTSALEVALAQAKVAQSQTQVTLAQSKLALDQANVTKIQAESALTTAQFNLDRIQAVGDIKDKIMKLQMLIAAAEVNRKQASATGDTEGFKYLNTYLLEQNAELNKRNAELQTLLGNAEYSGVTSYEIMVYDPIAKKYSLGGQTYDRLVVEDIRVKTLAVEAAQKAVEQAGNGIIMAQKTIDQANDGIALAQKNIDYIQKQINDSTITAPFAGTIATLYYKQGDIIPSPAVTPQTIIYLVDTDHLEVSANIDELDSPAIQVDQDAIININALTGTTLEGKVSAIATMPNAQAAASGTTVYVVKVAFDVPQGLAVKTGMNASVNIVSLVRKNVLLLPNDTIKQDNQGNSYVQIMKNQNITKQPVVIGARQGSQTEIISGLNEGDKVVSGIAWSLQGK